MHPELPTDSSFSREMRLRKSVEFEKVFGGKCYAADDTLVANAVLNELGKTRLGLSIGRKHGNAVVRNAWKRRIREAFRLNQHELPAGLDLVVRPRAGAQCDFRKIERSLCGLAKRLANKLNAERTTNRNH